MELTGAIVQLTAKITDNLWILAATQNKKSFKKEPIHQLLATDWLCVDWKWYQY